MLMVFGGEAVKSARDLVTKMELPENWRTQDVLKALGRGEPGVGIVGDEDYVTFGMGDGEHVKVVYSIDEHEPGKYCQHFSFSHKTHKEVGANVISGVLMALFEMPPPRSEDVIYAGEEPDKPWVFHVVLEWEPPLEAALPAEGMGETGHGPVVEPS